MLYILVILFILLVVAYLITNKVGSPDTWIIFVSVLVLLFTLLKPHPVEGFVNDGLMLKSQPVTLNDILSTNTKVTAEEDITDIASGLTFYTTAFNATSYPNFGKSWVNIAPSLATTPPQTCGSKTNSATNLTFDLTPIYSRKTGFYLGNNKLVGPYSSALNIQFHSTFSIVMVVKHSNLLVANGNNEIEFLKLYANSPNNNGMALYLKQNSLSVVNNVQMGNLQFQYSDQSPRQCLINKEDTLMHLDKDSLVFYYIIKDIDSIRILYMTEKSNIIYQLLRFNISNDDITFSNKEMVINRLASWNANIYNFAVYKTVMSDDNVTSFYNHVMHDYMKNADPTFTGIINKYNSTIDFLTNMTKCPLDKTACDTCTTVSSWVDPTPMIIAPSSCKTAVDTYCKANPKDAACKCWDTTSSIYASDSCKLYRSIFGNNKDNFLNFLSNDDLEYIKNKYKLLSLDECPKDLKKQKMLDNQYPKYDYNKLKINNVDFNKPEKCPTVPPTAPAVPSDSIDNVLIKEPLRGDDMKIYEAIVHRDTPPDIKDLYLREPNIEAPKAPKADEPRVHTEVHESTQDRGNRKTSEEIRQEAREASKMEEREQNMRFRIGTEHRHEGDFNTPAAATGTNRSAPSDQPKEDSFFNKFIKIMMPS
jgi:hypothetical protein